MLVCFGGAAAQGYVYYLCKNGRIEYMQGFLTGVPIAIVIFWFSCFFDDITLKKSGDKNIYIIKKLPRKILGMLFTLFCSGSVVFWLYIYHTNIARLF